MDAIAVVFYGVKITNEQARAIVKKNFDLIKNDEDENIDDLCDADLYDCLGAIGAEHGFESPTLESGYNEFDNEFGIGAIVVEQFHGSPAEEFEIPSDAELDKKWKKIAETLKIKKKPKWYIFANSF